MNDRSHLANQDVARQDVLAGVPLDSASLSLRVAAVS